MIVRQGSDRHENNIDIYDDGKSTKVTVFINGHYHMGIDVDKGNTIGVTQRKVSSSHGDDDVGCVEFPFTFN